MSETVGHRRSSKKVFLKISQYSQENTWVGAFNKAADLKAWIFIEERFQYRYFSVKFEIF